MTAANYDASLARVLKHEGGYTNHPSDPGGPTNFGITIHDYRRYIKTSGTAADVRDMTRADAAKIYRARYWQALRCDELPAGLDYALFDYGVNSGIGRAAKVLQRLLGIGQGTAVTDRECAQGQSFVADRPDVRRTCRLPEKPQNLAGIRRRLGTQGGRGAARCACDGEGFIGCAGRHPRSQRQGKRASTKGRARGNRGGFDHGRRRCGAGRAYMRRVALIVSFACCCGPVARGRRMGGMECLAKAQAGGARHRYRYERVMNRLSERFKGWRTLIFGGAVTLAGAMLDILDALHVVDITPLLPPDHALKIIAVIGIMTVVLRFVTTGRIGSKDC